MEKEKDCGCTAQTDLAKKKKSKVLIDVNPTLESVDLLRFNKTAVIAVLEMSPPTKAHDDFVEQLWDLTVDHESDAPVIHLLDRGAVSSSDRSSIFTPSDAREMATECYGDIINPVPVHSLYEAIKLAKSNYTKVVAVVPETYATEAIDGVEYVFIEGFDEAAIQDETIYIGLNKDLSDLEDHLAEGIEYLAEDIQDMIQSSFEEDDLTEAPLNYSQRLKRAQVFRRNKRKIAIARERMRRKIATNDKLKTRARRKAIQAVRKKVAGARGLDYQNLSVGEKIQIDKRVAQRQSAVDRIARKLLPKLRKDELQRVRQARQPVKEDIDVINTKTDKKKRQEFRYLECWHQLHNKDGTVKFDGRFKIWKRDQKLVDVATNDELMEALSARAEEHDLSEDIVMELFQRGMFDIEYDHLTEEQAGFNRISSFVSGNYFLEDLDLMERADDTCAVITKADLRELEKFADSILEKFGIDIEFTRHFGERMSDDRNDPCITVKEMRDFFRKLAVKQGKPIKNARETEVILKDIQKNLNLPVVINYYRGKFEVVLKTIMRKKKFLSSSPTVTV